MYKALMIAAIAAGAVDAKFQTYAQKRVAENRAHLEHVYGKGLVGLFNEKGQLTHENLRKANAHRPRANPVEINGIGTIDQEQAQAFFYGLAKGMQYSGLSLSGAKQSLSEAVQSNCFYAVYGLTSSAETLKYDLQNIVGSGSFNWFNVMAYDPFHYLGDLTVAYQYCGGDTQLQNLVSLASVDYSYISQAASTQITYMLTQYKDLQAQFAETRYTSGDDGTQVMNLFQAGEIWGKIIANMFQNTIAPSS